MKPKYWWWIGAGITFLLLLFFLIVVVLILDQSWWWFLGDLIISGVVWAILGIVFLIKKLKEVEPLAQVTDLRDAKQIVINEMLYDDDNPDNFIVLTPWKLNVGEKGSEKTPIGVFWGYGSELDEKRVAVVNLKKPKKNISILIDPSKEEVSEAIRVMADNPPDPDVWEETVTKLDLFGKPMTTTRVRKPGGISKEKQEEKKAEEMNSI